MYTIKRISSDDPQREDIICGSPYICEYANGEPQMPDVSQMYDGMICYTHTTIYICRNFHLHMLASIGEVKIMPENLSYEGWLKCDGTSFDISKYEYLYNILGTNLLPDIQSVTGFSYYIRATM